MENNKIKNLQVYSSIKKLTGKPSIDRPWLKYYSDETLNYELPKTKIYDFMYNNNKDFPEGTALNYYGSKITYEEMFKKIDETAKAFKQLGVQAGDVVTVCLPTIPENVYTFYALNKIGAVADFVDVTSNPTLVKHYLEEVNSKYLVTIDALPMKDGKVIEKIDSIINETKLKKVIVTSIDESLPLMDKIGYGIALKTKKQGAHVPSNSKYVKWSNFISDGKNYNGNIEANYEEGKTAVMVHTGGTTGVPKAVELSNDSLNTVITEYQHMDMKFERGQKFMDFLPTFIITGVCNGMHLPICTGMETIIIPDYDPTNFAKYLTKYKPNHATGAPIYWKAMLADKKANKMDLSFLGYLTSGAESMSSSLENRINDFLAAHRAEIKIGKGYGMTEVCSSATYTLEKVNEICSVGIPFPHTIVSIFDPETNEEIGYNKSGEIRVSGPTMMNQYHANEEDMKKVFWIDNDGKKWVCTGDRGYMTEDGKLYVDGRIKRMITRDGYNIYPDQIQKIIEQHSGVDACEVVGINNETHGQLPVVNVILKSNYNGNEEQIQKELYELCVQGNIFDYAMPYGYKFRTSFPIKSQTGKVDFQKLSDEGLEFNDSVSVVYEDGKRINNRLK